MSMSIFFNAYKKKLTLDELCKLDTTEETKLTVYSDGLKGQWWLVHWIENNFKESLYTYDCSGISILNKDILIQLDTYCDDIILNGYKEDYDIVYAFNLWLIDLETEKSKIEAINIRVNKVKNFIKELLENYNETYTYTLEYYL